MRIGQGKVIQLRPFEWADAEIYRQWVNDPEIMLLVDRVLPVTADEHRRWYEFAIKDSHVVMFAIDELPEKTFIGSIWLHAIDYRHRHAEMRVLIGNRDYWGTGAGIEAISMLVQFAFKNLNLHKVYAYVLTTNERALKTFRKVGFIREGVLKQERYVNGKFVDVVRFGCVRKV